MSSVDSSAKCSVMLQKSQTSEMFLESPCPGSETQGKRVAGSFPKD